MISVNATAYVVDEAIEVKTLTMDGAERHVTQFRIQIRKRPRRSKKRGPVFITLEVWGADALNAQKYLRKGSAIAIKADLDLDEWTDKDTGKKRRVHYLIADEVEFLDRMGLRDGGPDAGPGESGAGSDEGTADPAGTVAEDDIPF